uniref:Uncharacterized protein n=1 Tax=Globodera rostochiensis TaxID=31243 RepID=A0A914H0R3_GLORO
MLKGMQRRRGGGQLSMLGGADMEGKESFVSSPPVPKRRNFHFSAEEYSLHKFWSNMASNIVGQRRNGGAAAGGGETPEGVPQKSDTLSIAAAPPAVIVVANGQIEVNTKTLIAAAAAVNGVNGGEKVVMNGRATEAADRSPVNQRLGRGQSAPKLLLDGSQNGLLTTLCEENGAGGGDGTEKEARRKDEGKENGDAGILETMKAKMMTMKTNNNNNNNTSNSSRNRNNTLPPLPLTNGLRHRVHRSQSPSLFGSTKKRCGPKLDTKERLFGQILPETPKKKLNDTYRSTIFSDTVPNSPAKTPKKCVPVLERNPITGEVKLPKKITM